MTLHHTIGAERAVIGSGLNKGLARRFGERAGHALAARFLAAEELDFLWDARIAERWLGGYESLEEEDGELDRVAVIGRLDRRWYTAICLVDGEGHAHGLLGRRWHDRACRAHSAYRQTP